MSAGGARRRARGGRSWRPDLVTVLAVVVPVATVAALGVVRASTAPAVQLPPTQVPLTRADLVCPAASDGTLLLGSSGTASGSVRISGLGTGSGPGTSRAAVRPPAVSEVTGATAGDGAVVVSASGALAPGLAGTRTGSRLSATGCATPRPETWFAGLGARAGHDTVLELDNPDTGAAVVDIDLYAPRGPVPTPGLLGIRVPGRTSMAIDLGQAAPRRRDLGAHVVVSRGRVAVTATDRVGGLGAGEGDSEWLPGQAAPQAENTLVGLLPGQGSRTLSVLNPGTEEARVSVKVISPESVFTPSGVDELALAPGATARVTLDEVLSKAAEQGAVGLQVSGSRPVVTSLASRTDQDVTVTAPAARITDEGIALVPRGSTRVQLAGATTSGLAVVVARDADGAVLRRQRVELAADRGWSLRVPDGTASVTVTAEHTGVVAAATVERGGGAVVPVVEPPRYGFRPTVRPGSPQSRP